MYHAILDNAGSAANSIILIFKRKVTVYIFIVISNNGTSDIYWNRFIRRTNQMTFRSINFQLLKLNHPNIFLVVISSLFMTVRHTG